jgi:hypothetical protein
MNTPSTSKPTTKSVVITARIDPETAALLDKVGAAQGRSRSWLVAQAVKNTLEIACQDGDPNAPVPELVALLAKRQSR